jgi:hypothetical protein
MMVEMSQYNNKPLRRGEGEGGGGGGGGGGKWALNSAPRVRTYAVLHSSGRHFTHVRAVGKDGDEKKKKKRRKKEERKKEERKKERKKRKKYKNNQFTDIKIK